MEENMDESMKENTQATGQPTPPVYGEPQMQGQQTPPFYGNPQMQYQQVPPVYQNQYAGKEKGDEIALGIASMCLGIASLLLFCTCVNVAMAIASVILGILQIVKNKNKVFSRLFIRMCGIENRLKAA